jgi:putative (di)nucleoside polyphosphate hydrolase
MNPDGAPPGYRLCVGIMLFNREGLVFAGQRRDIEDAAWQMPQGGIDSGEPPRDAALRELDEEVGTDKVEIVAESKTWLTYDFPSPLKNRAWGGKFTGQAQRWFLMRFTGDDTDIDIDASDHAEFSAWRWMPLEDLVGEIIPFKRPVYRQIAAEFGPIIRDVSASG